MNVSNGLVGIAVVALLGCGGGEKKVGKVEQPGGGAGPTTAEPAKTGPDSWEGWQAWQKMSKEKWPSKTHGGRFVEVYVNDVGLEAYMAGEETEMPVGSIVIKPSWENENGQPGAEGPVFIMEKKAAGFAPDSGDWFYAFQWDNPTGEWKKKLGGPVKWESPSDKVTYCVDCHDSYDRQLGGVPEDKRAW